MAIPTDEACREGRAGLTRRGFLAAGAAFTVWSGLPRFARAGTRDPRLVFVVLRGGLDGIAAVAPVGDPAYPAMREDGVLPADGPHARLPLDADFALNGRMRRLHAMYREGDALLLHAVHTPYRERSHFDAQDVLENGTTAPDHHEDGWLGRLVSALPMEERMRTGGGFAVAPATPLVMRGTPNVLTWMPPGISPASDDTRARLLNLWEHTDPALADALEAGLALDAFAGSEREIREAARDMREAMPDASWAERQQRVMAASAGRTMAADDGPRIGFLDMTGFDTHRRQRAVDGRLANRLEVLDSLLGALRDAMAPVWRDTVVVVATEFGRTVRLNGSDGTDHGAATVAMLLGGAVAGGRVVADWPGLAERGLFEGRDLMPTTDLRAVLKGVLRDHVGAGERLLAERVFPGTAGLRPIDDLLRA